MNDLREEVRSWLIEAELGLIEKDELVSRVDARIAELEESPNFLTGVSMCEDLKHVTRLDLLKEPIDQNDSAIFARTLLEQWKDGKIGVEKVAYLATNAQLRRNENGTDEPWTQLSWITVELELLKEGVDVSSLYFDRIVQLLEKIASNST